MELVQPAAQIRRSNRFVAEIYQFGMRQLGGVGPCIWRIVARAYDLDPQCAGTTIQFFDSHEHPHCLTFKQNPIRDPFGQGFQQVQALV